MTFNALKPALAGVSLEIVNSLTISEINEISSIFVTVLIGITTIYKILSSRKTKKNNEQINYFNCQGVS